MSRRTVLALSVGAELKDRIREAAEAEGLGMSQWVRRVAKQALDARPPTPAQAGVTPEVEAVLARHGMTVQPIGGTGVDYLHSGRLVHRGWLAEAEAIAQALEGEAPSGPPWVVDAAHGVAERVARLRTGEAPRG